MARQSWTSFEISLWLKLKRQVALEVTRVVAHFFSFWRSLVSQSDSQIHPDLGCQDSLRLLGWWRSLVNFKINIALALWRWSLEGDPDASSCRPLRMKGSHPSEGLRRQATVSCTSGMQEACLSLERKRPANTLNIFFYFFPTLWVRECRICANSGHCTQHSRKNKKTRRNSAQRSSPGFSSCSSRWATLTGLGRLQLFWTFAGRRRWSEVMSVLQGSTVSGLGY